MHRVYLRIRHSSAGNTLYTVAVLSGFWLVQARLNLNFTQSIATAMTFAPVRRSTAPVRSTSPDTGAMFGLAPLFQIKGLVINES
jgi:hypothetical protein